MIDVYCDDGELDLIFSPEGPMGPPGQDLGFTRLAQIALGGQRVIRDAGDGVNATYADPANLGDAALILGISVASANAGAPLNIQSGGDMVDPSWAWTPGAALFVGTAGALTQTPPSGAWTCQVAVAVNATKIVIRVGLAIYSPV